ncbi:HAMP domain-containing sensor histidine kinase [Fulvivirgaceae bacterium BMA10]|uniref:histidine kinase n=1 Tax=Splendidivirga corallicola TaxID=3051826 RepID=A0ABT8KK04_9BACT|nr:HAMP domain-containing sensor histidine kinase [Fulvivirgaceae bacterium BMA10]
MKLLNKITLVYLLCTLVVFAIGGIITFDIFKQEIALEEKRHLFEQMKILSRSISEGSLPDALNNEKIQIDSLGVLNIKERNVFSDTLVWHPWLKRMELNLKLTSWKKIDSVFYKITLHDIVVESDDIYDGVKKSLTRTYLLLLVVIVLLNILIYVWLFKPFNITLQKIRNFSLQDAESLDLPYSSTKEFAKLNDFIERMTEKVRNDYQTLKEFSENASHEMQTPLAIAKGKMELLMESGKLSNDQLELINAAYNSISKLSKLGNSLSLLTKIENKEFHNTEEIDLSQQVKQILFDFKELLDLKNIHLEQSIEENVRLNIHPHLADILLSNLFQNAIRHNIKSGTIWVKLDHQSLTISNTGVDPDIEPDQLFDRFKKGNQSAESLGLGLAIIKKICDVNNLRVKYDYVDGEHSLVISFNN